jgi:hypothetical protein
VTNVERLQTGLESVDWAEVASTLTGNGWIRLVGLVSGAACARLLGAAPATWIDTPEHQIGTVREAGMTCGVVFTDASPQVRRFGDAIRDGINSVIIEEEVPPLPPFTDVQWGRARPDGAQFITAHRDPARAGGVIAITTLSGAARFRIWHARADPRRSAEELPSTTWQTGDGDLVLLAANGWPQPDDRCPVHEVASPNDGQRITMTLRHNIAGPGADYFPP